MSEIKDGGAAFPLPLGGRHDQYMEQPGMTLRDWFAGQALPAVMNDHYASQGESWKDGVAHEAYSMADAMLAAREVQS